MSVKPVHITVGKKVQTDSTTPVMAGQFWWDESEFELGNPGFRTTLFVLSGSTTATVELVDLEGSVVVSHTTTSGSVVEQTTTVSGSLTDLTIYEVRVKSGDTGIPVVLGSAELIIS